MDFSIVIPVRNRPEEIKRCVASCYASRYSPTAYEVIVVDNGSTDQTARAASQAGARVISEPQPNRCRARNLGAGVARGRWIAFTDSDCEVDPDWLSELAAAEGRLKEAGSREKTAALAGRILPGEPKSPAEAYIAARGWLDQEKFLSHGRKFSPPFAATANLAIRREAFLAVGPFDPDLSIAGEDADWCWRAAAAGFSVEYVPAARVIHHHRSTLRALMRQAYHYGIGNADLFAKYREAWGARSWVEFDACIWAVKGLLKAPWTALFADDPKMRWAGLYDFATNLAQTSGRARGGLRHRILIL